MPALCMTFQVHQPCILKRYTAFDIGRHHRYEDLEKNRRIMDHLAESCCLPTNSVLLRLIEEHEGKFRLAFSISGATIQLCEKYRPDILDSFRRLADTGYVEFLGETAPPSLAFLFSPKEFREQIELHKKKIRERFGQVPGTFPCAGLIYDNELVKMTGDMSYSTFTADGGKNVTGSPRFIFSYQAADFVRLKLLLRNYRLSDDIQLRFSGRDACGHPLKAGPFVRRLIRFCNNGGGQAVSLLFDYGRIGKSRRTDTEILEFLRELTAEVLRQPDFRFLIPSEIVESQDPAGFPDATDLFSLFDGRRDLTACTGNAMQKDALRALYDLEETVRKRKDADCLATWRMMQTLDYFYYMCTEGLADGVKKHDSNPYASPYEAYINYMNIIDDFSRTLQS